MEWKKAGMAMWAIVFVGFVAAASMWWALAPSQLGNPVPASASPQAGVPSGAIRTNGAHPLVPLRSLWLSGEVLELPDVAGTPTVTVEVGGLIYPAQVQGRTYQIEIGHPPMDAMVVIDARAPSIRFRSVVGSVQRLRALAGADASLTIDEHAALKVSPFSTALESAVRFTLKGRDAASDAEFAEAVRAGTNAELELTAYVLLNVAHYPDQIPAPYTSGYELLQDRDAYREFSSYPWVKQYGSGYLFRQDEDGAPVRALSELPERLVLQDGLPYGDVAAHVNRLAMLTRLPDGTYEFHTNAAWYRPRFSVTLGERGVVTMTPIERVWQGFVDGGDQYPVNAERSVYTYSLRRMAMMAGGVDIWAFVATYRLPPTPFGGFRPAYEYSVMSGVGMESWREPGMIAAASGQVLPLPWFCTGTTAENPLQHIAPCDYVQHRFAAEGGYTVEHGWRVDPGTLAPVSPVGSQAFGWSAGTDGVLQLTTAVADTQIWRVRTPLPGGDSAQGPGNILLLTRSREQATMGQERLDIGMTLTRRIDAVGAGRGGDEWEYSQSRMERSLYSGYPGLVVRTSRRQNGTSTSLYSREGVVESRFDAFWQVVSGAIYDGRGVGYMTSGATQYFRNCTLANSAGATTCSTQYVAFRPIATHGNRVYGIESTYQTPVWVSGGVSTVQPMQRLSVNPTYYECLGGSCPVNTATAASLPAMAGDSGAQRVRAGRFLAPAPVEFTRYTPRISDRSYRIPRLMPIYAFECTQCGHSFDRLQKLSDPDPDTCPSCGAQAVKRQLTAPSFRLAGSGWYETDFKKDGDKKRNLADGGEGAKPSSESKPAESSPAKTESAPAKTDAKPATPSSTSST
jgi:putative FmdB family regulatory protein